MVIRRNVNIFHDKWLLSLLIFMTVMSMCLFTYGYAKHYSYLTSLNDVGHIDQSIWGTINGKIFLNTINFNRESVGRIEPIILIFVPFYLFSPNIDWLILAQSISIPAAGLPIYFIARKVSCSCEAAFFWALSYMVSPFVLNAASWDFHPVFLAVPLVSLALWALEENRPCLFIFSCILILLSKEHFGLLVVGFGILWYTKNGGWRLPFFLISTGIVYFYIVMNIVYPWLSPTGQHPMISSEQGQMSRYGWLGTDFDDVMFMVLSKPFDVMKTSLFGMGGWLYVVLLFIPVLFLPSFSLNFLIPGVSDFLANILSSNPMPKSIFSYHSITLIPIIIVSSVYASCRMQKMAKFMKNELQSFAVLLITVFMVLKFSNFINLEGVDCFWKSRFTEDHNYKKIILSLPSEMSVSAQANVGAHFSQRNCIYMYPNMVGDADAIVLHLASPTDLVSGDDKKKIGTLAHHLQMDPKIYLDEILDLLNGDIYGRVVWIDPWLIFYKEGNVSSDKEKIREKIRMLKKEWL